MWRTTLVFIYLLSNFTALFGQSKNQDAFYVFDAEWNSAASIEKAVYLCREKKLNDSTWQLDTYNIDGPLIRSGTFRDKECTVAHGEFHVYNKKGKIDSVCNYADGLEHGTWYVFNDTGKIVAKSEYIKGKLIRVIDVLKEDSTNANNKDTVAIKDEKESVFKGGLNGWRRYLEKNLKYPDRALGMQKEGEVRVGFIVDTEGNIEEPYIFKSVEFSLDEEALRIINKSPKWIPGEQNGKLVKCYKVQPIVFRLR